MKKTLLLTLILFCASRSLAQIALDSFYLDGTEWTETYKVPGGQGSYTIYSYIIRVDGDTSINGQDYRKIYYSQGGYVSRDASLEGVFTYSTVLPDFVKIGGIRVDDQKIYFILTDTLAGNAYYRHTEVFSPLIYRFGIGVEKIIYDFGVAIGDSIAWKTAKPKVLDIDTMAMDNNLLLRRYLFDSVDHYTYSDHYWLYGVGSNRSFLFSGTPPGFFASVCYRSPLGDLHFPSVYLPDTTLIIFCMRTLMDVGSKEKKTELSIYPNPLQGEKILLKGDLQSIEYYEIYDVTGRLQGSGNLDSYAISVPAAPGSYILKLRCKDGSTISKIFSKL